MILVSVLGDFSSSILPVFYNFKQNITKHILIYDDFKRDVSKAQEFSRGFENFKKKYNYSFELIKYSVDEDSIKSIEECSDFITSQTQNKESIYLNTTDGFSTLTTLLYANLVESGVKFIAYDMFDNEYNLLDKEGLNKRKIINNLNIEDHFLLKGFRTQKRDFSSFANKYENTIQKLFQNHYKEFDSYTKLPRGKYRQVKNLPQGVVKESFLAMDLGDLDTHNALLTGGLFEYYIYNLLKDLDYDDIEVGFIVQREYNDSFVPNEFDILILKNNHLHNIECKFRKVVDMNELVYKYTALSNFVDEDGATIVILKNPIEYDIKNISHAQSLTPLKRAALNNIVFKGGVHLQPQRFREYVQNLLQTGIK